MTVIQHKAFTGEFLRVLPHNLPPGAAQLTQDCDFTRSNLTGIKVREAVAGVYAPNAKSLFVYDSLTFSYYSWQRDVDAVRSPVASDAYSRFYWCDGANFWVSRGDVGGNGNEPSGTNRYWVGVPQPAAALELASGSQTFSVSGYQATGFTAFCEKADGTRGTVTPLTITPGTSTLGSYIATAAASIVCNASSGSSGGGKAALYYWFDATFYPDKYASPGITLNFFASKALGQFTVFPTGAPYYVYWPAKTGLSIPSVLYPTDVIFNGTITPRTPFYHIGNGWFCTNRNAVAPSGGASTVTAQISKLAVEVTFANDAGKTLTAVLREDSNANTYPPELAGLAGRYTYDGSTISLSLSSRSDYLEARGYVCTYVNQYGEEGPPSDPLVIDIAEGTTPTLRYPVPSATALYAPISRIRVYRTATGTSNTDYLYVGEAVINSTNPTFEDTVNTSALGESIQTRGFYPPDQNLKGLCALPNGILAAFKDNEIHFSEPYLPYAWKTANIQALQNRIVGICPFENGLYVTTTAHPVVITGVSPDTMTAQKIPAIQAGVSKGSICNAGPYAVYASHDGLVTLRGLDATLDLSFQFFTREQWRSLYGNKLYQMRLNVHDGHLLMWFEDGSPGFLMRLDETNPSFTRTTDPVYCATVHPQSDSLYVGAASTIYVYKGGSARLPFKWQSGDYILNKPESLGCIQLVGGGTFQITVFADGTSVYTTSVTVDLSGSTLLRLPSGFLARRWSFLVEGVANSYLYEMPVAGVPQELKNV